MILFEKTKPILWKGKSKKAKGKNESISAVLCLSGFVAITLFEKTNPIFEGKKGRIMKKTGEKE